MPLGLDIKRKLAQKSGRVKSVDLHPTEPWILTSLYSGSVCIWDYQSQTMAKSFEVTELPVRSAKFVARKQWVVAGADDMFIRVYNYNTMDKVKVYEAHTDYIRCVAVHPTLPYILSSSDDMLIKLWNWEKSWHCTQIFEGHSHYVMQVTINPKDTNTFASASLDRTIKVWNLGSPDPKFTIDAHIQGLNCVDYFTCSDKSYLISGSDDHTAKVWDYKTKTCVRTLEGHTHNVTAAYFHPDLPIIITGSEDGTVRIWHSTTYRLENTLNYGFERVWAVGYIKGSRRIAIAYDEGTIMVKVGREMPIASMNNTGKITWAKRNEIQTVNIKSVGADGERLPLAVKDLGTCDLYPLSLEHDPNGMFVAVCGDGEYIMYTSLPWRKRSSGSALEIVWSSDSEYAVRESTTKIKIFNKSFQEKKSIRPTFSTEAIYGGALLAMCSNDFVCFYDWAECILIQRIDVSVKKLYWADSGDMLAIANDSSFYIVQYNNDVVSAHLDSGRSVDEQGIQDSFKFLYEVNERVRTGLWVGDCFIYTNSSWRLNYCVGGEVTTMFHLDRPMYLLGYLANQSRVYLIDKEFNVSGYTLVLTLIQYKTLVLCGDLKQASIVLPSIPKEHHNSVAHFMESRGMTEEALKVATDPDYRFDLAIQLGKLEIAKDIALVAKSRLKWKQLGELAMSTGQLDMAEDCLKRANDLSGLVKLYSVLGNAKEIEKLTPLAKGSGKNNVAFSCLFMLGKLDECLQLLVDSNRIPEGALMARAYLPNKVPEIFALWRKDLNKNAADPKEYPNRYEDWNVALEVEARAAQTRRSYPVAEEYVNYDGRSHVSLVEVFQHMWLDIEKSRENKEMDHEGIRQPTASPANSKHGGGKSQYPQRKEVEAQGLKVNKNRKEGGFIVGQQSSTFKINKIFVQRTERVKSLDLHPTKPWVLLGLYSGTVCIWNFHSQVTHKSLEISKLPVRTAKFIARKEWIVFGDDDGFIRVYEYNDMGRIKELKAHTDYIRSVVVHPSLSYILSASDDKLIKLWDWSNGWDCIQTFHGHESYVMQLAFSPRDTNVFASASLDCTIKTWNLGSSSPRLSIECHQKGLNALEFFDTDEKLYLVTGSDDHTAKVWDYETGTSVKTLEGHTNNVTSVVCVNSNVNFIITGSEDKSVRVWNATTYNLEHVFTSELGRVWTIGFIKDSSQVILGCDEGILIGRVIPSRS